MDKLIPVINRLQKVFNTAGTALVQLPQIVVIGEQSSGKSSVLESLVGRSCLPRGINFVTRCPIVLQMIQTDPEDEYYINKVAELKVEEWFEFPHLPENEMIVTDFNSITTIINEVVIARAGGSKGIIEEELLLRILSPRVINLTVVDLPGIVRNATADQPDNIEEQVRTLLTTYIANPNCIILAVSAANNDIATSESIKLAKTVDPNCDRTIAVVTKLDLMDKGTDAVDVLTGKVLQVKLGIIGVVNRSYDDIRNKVTIAQSIANEARFLLETYPTVATDHGIPFLKTRLQKLLMEHIKKCLPPLQTRLMSMQIQAKNALGGLGCDEPTNKAAVMLDIIETFCNGFKATILGKNRHIQKKILTGGAQINFAFEEKLTESLKDIDPLKDLENGLILTTIQNARSIESSVLIPESAYQDIVRDQIKRLEKPALLCADNINTEMLNIMGIWMTILEKDMQRFPNLTTAISLEVMKVLGQRHLKAQELLKSYVDVQASFIKTKQVDFNEKMLELLKANSISKDQLYTATENPDGVLSAVIGEKLTEAQNAQCMVVRLLVHSYYEIVKTAFEDYVPKAISHSVIYYLEEHIMRHLIEQLYHPDQIENLVKESEIIQDKRLRITSTLEALDEAIEVIREIGDIPL